MKKALKMLFVSALAATLFTSVALAEVTVSGWGRALFTPAGTEGGEISPDRGVSWGGGQRIGFTVAGNSDNMGFQVDLKADNGIDQSLNNNDQQKVWVKPMDMIKLEVGYSIFYDRYRGNSGFGSWNWLRPGAVGADEDLTFRRVSVNDGAVLEISPMPALGIFAAWGDTQYEWAGDSMGISGMYKDEVEADDGGTPDDTSDDTAAVAGEPLTTAQMLTLGQYGAGFDFGVGTARAQIIGRRNKGTDADYMIYNAAVKLDKLMPALYVDLGFYGNTDADNATGSDHNNTEVALYVKYAMAPMTFHVQADVLLDKDTADEQDTTAMAFGLGFDMDLGNGMGITSDVRYADANYCNDATNAENGEVAVMAGVTQGFSNGVFGAAFQFSTFKLARYGSKENGSDSIWALPIRVEYWF